LRANKSKNQTPISFIHLKSISTQGLRFGTLRLFEYLFPAEDPAEKHNFLSQQQANNKLNSENKYLRLQALR